MQGAKKEMKKIGIKIRNIFPPRAFIIEIGRSSLEQIRKLDFVKDVFTSRIENKEKDLGDVFLFWNNKFPNTERDEKEVKKTEQPFRDDLIIPEMPSEEERKKMEEKYLQRWQKKKKELREEELKKLSPDRKRSLNVKREDIEIYELESFSQAYKAHGADYYDTSLYMAGEIAVGFFFSPGDRGDWKAEDIDTVFAELTNKLNEFIDEEPNANISFVFHKEVDAEGNPFLLPEERSNEFDCSHISSHSNYRTQVCDRNYINDLRNKYNTHWAYMVQVINGDGRANAYLGGPSMRIYRDDLRNGLVIRHETMHIFGAKDQYCPDACESPTDIHGYLKVVNANSRGNNGKGFFNGSGEGLRDIMNGRSNKIGTYSRGQIGWRDSD